VESVCARFSDSPIRPSVWLTGRSFARRAEADPLAGEAARLNAAIKEADRRPREESSAQQPPAARSAKIIVSQANSHSQAKDARL